MMNNIPKKFLPQVGNDKTLSLNLSEFVTAYESTSPQPHKAWRDAVPSQLTPVVDHSIPVRQGNICLKPNTP
jgi:hypothetical protein